MNIDVKKQIKLFQTYHQIGQSIARAGYLIQNDLNEFPATPEQFAEWNAYMLKLASGLEKLRQDTFEFVSATFPPEENPIDKF